MVDPVIDEHFRRSLGADYMNLFGKGVDPGNMSSPPMAATINKSPQLSPVQLVLKNSNRRPETTYQSNDKFPSNNGNSDSDKETTEDVEMSVDDHFAKALGDTWKQLQQNNKTQSELESDPESEHENGQSDDSDTKKIIQPSRKDEDSSKSPCHR